MRVLAAAAPLAEQQLGLIARRQLIARGVAASAIDAAVARGTLVRVRRGVYRIPGAPDTPPARLLAVVLAAGDGTLVSHQSAAWLWSLAPPPERHHLSVRRGTRPRRLDAVVHESSDLDLAVPGLIGGLPVTGVGRTILDCAGDPTTDVELLIDAARRTHGISRTLLPATLVAHARSGRRGIRRLADLLVLDEVPHSDFERLVCRWLGDVGLVGWRVHHRIVVPGRGPVELDIAWPDLTVALELEGADHRDRATVHDDDTERQNRLVASGWSVVRTTYRRWVRHTDAVLEELADVLELAAHRLSATASWQRARLRSHEPV